MDSLPNNVLHMILRRVGRPTRRVCRRWRAAYGPPAGLYLPHSAILSHLPALRALAAGHPPTHTVAVRPRFERDHGQQFQGNLLARLAATFPTLRALHLPRGAIAAAQLPPLAPLAPHLTALHVILPDAPAAALIAGMLTALRSLTFALRQAEPTAGPHQPPPLVEALAALARLPHLHHLHYLGLHVNGARPHFTPRSCPAPAVLQPLAAMPGLTHVAINTRLTDWDRASLALLATAWPRLASLALSLNPSLDRFMRQHLHHPDSPPPPAASDIYDDIVAALQQRATLTTLALAVARSSQDQASTWHSTITALSRLASLTLAHPQAPLPFGSSTDLALPAAAAAAPPPSALTHLAFSSMNARLNRQLLDTCALLSATLAHFHFTSSSSSIPPLHQLEPLRHLTALRSLHLLSWGHPNIHPARPVAEIARIIAAALTRLTSLLLWELPWPADDLAAVVAAVAAHAPLRHLQASTSWPPPPAAQQPPPWLPSLAPAASTLVRLCIRAASTGTRQLLGDLAGLTCLRALTIMPPRESAVDNGQHWKQERNSDGAAELPGAFHLPPGLRLLVLDAECLGEEAQRRLLEAATQQDCAVHTTRTEGWLPQGGDVPEGWVGGEARPPAYDDCNGYLDGAAAQCVSLCNEG